MTEEILKTQALLADHRGGRLRSLRMVFDGQLCEIPLRSDRYHGVCWLIDGQEISTEAREEGGRMIYTGKSGDLLLTLFYSAGIGNSLVITATMENLGSTSVRPLRASLRLGFDTYLERYPNYNDQLFPTLLRCEKTHLWGYFSTPSGRLLAIFTDAPTASYTLDYEENAQGIFTASLDLLHPGPLPQRHPQGQDHLLPGEKKAWHITLLPIEIPYDILALKPTIAEASCLPLLHGDRYTIARGRKAG